MKNSGLFLTFFVSVFTLQAQPEKDTLAFGRNQVQFLTKNGC